MGGEVADPDYGYDGDGLRAFKRTGSPTTGARTYFLYDGETPVAEMDSTGSVIAVNTFGPRGLLSRHTSSGSASGSTFYAFDPQGSAAARLDGTGAVLAYYTLDAFGSRVGTDSSGDPYSGFGGQWGYYSDSETGLQLLTHRYYDVSTGRFITRDPIGYNGGVNLYAYTTNNPVTHSDPSGFQAEEEVVIGEDEIIAEIAAAWAEAEEERESEIEEFLNRSNRPVIRGLGDPILDLLWGNRPGEGMPGINGVMIPRRPTVPELENLQAKHGVEFAVTYRRGPYANGRGGAYFLYSGTYRSCPFDFRRGDIWIAHTQPNHLNASPNDILRLQQYSKYTGQRSSLIVSPGQGAKPFTIAPRSIRRR